MRDSRLLFVSGCALSLVLASLSLGVSAHDDGDPIPRFAFPADHVGLRTWEGGCPWFGVDRDRSPTIRRTGEARDGAGAPVYTYDVAYHAIDTGICFSPPPPGFAYSPIVDIGPLPLGSHVFTIRGLLPDGTELIEYERQVQVLLQPPFVRPDVTGVWYAREQNGRGVTVMQSRGLTLLYWAMHDATGAPAWVLLPPTQPDGNVVQGEAITTRGDPLAAGVAALDAEAWGHVSFTYHRCARATLTWDAEDPAVGDGSLDLMQVLVPDAGSQPCLAEDDPDSLQATWLQD